MGHEDVLLYEIEYAGTLQEEFFSQELSKARLPEVDFAGVVKSDAAVMFISTSVDTKTEQIDASHSRRTSYFRLFLDITNRNLDEFQRLLQEGSNTSGDITEDRLNSFFQSYFLVHEVLNKLSPEFVKRSVELHDTKLTLKTIRSR